MVQYNSETINVRDLISVLSILPEDSTIFVNSKYELAWKEVDEDNPGGVIEFERQCVNPHGVLALRSDEGIVFVHGPDDDGL